jgi:phosphatidate cytidylyltransferase
MSAWSHIDCSPVNPVFTAVPWKLPDMLITISKTLVSLGLNI